jgi:hypothetical protein
VIIKRLKFGPSTTITVGPSQVTYRTRTPQGDRLIRVLLLDVNNPRVMAWTERLHQGIEVNPYALSISSLVGIVYDALRRLNRDLPATLQSFDLQLVLSPSPKSGDGANNSQENSNEGTSK